MNLSLNNDNAHLSLSSCHLIKTKIGAVGRHTVDNMDK